MGLTKMRSSDLLDHKYVISYNVVNIMRALISHCP